MLGFIKGLLGSSKGSDQFQASKEIAKNRLQFVLVQDRGGLGNAELAKFKRELIEVVSRYFDVDERSLDIDYRREQEMTTLQINSTVLNRRDSEQEVELTDKFEDEEGIESSAG